MVEDEQGGRGKRNSKAKLKKKLPQFVIPSMWNMFETIDSLMELVDMMRMLAINEA